VAKKKRKRQPEDVIKRNGPVPYDVRVRIIQAVMRGTKYPDAAAAFGVSTAAVQKFVGLFEHGGMDALRLRPMGAAAVNKKKNVPRAEVVAAREANPEWGTRRIRDVLARFEGLGVSETTVRRILHEEGLLVEREQVEPRDKPPRRFERAEPNQMWQSDIFTFELRRHQRVYVVGFMDDYSRYLVSWAMAHHQKASLVIEALERGIAVSAARAPSSVVAPT
jgi:transposase